MAAKRALTAADILPWAEYAKDRMDTRRRIGQTKRNRRVDVGPNVTFYFESFETMWLQVQEMLHIERGGEEQLKDELAAYNPLIPQGQELVATFMIEIDEPERRKRILSRVGGIEDTAFMMINGEKIAGRPEEDQDRTTEAGKASSVQFVHFAFSPAQIEAFKKPGTQVIVGLGHENYNHMAVLTETSRAELAKDFD
ncbi:DUF3501 family protein [Methylocella sp. CPCC 101449]|uniref:DUF3501 family protein n=1 Tax=Methylocella sp. CPCC 101449 TaxID=2987531 RepID=UPI0028929244|nr:DUF3501 family protein [Methylocella sp. CPCC 101449]MDT2021544.1 DUF3501 family protein [Methylocella sp. CPCC 101449]